MADYIPEITALLPQRPPFIMVDRLLYADGTTARASFRVRPENPLVVNGFFTEAGLVENIAQTAAAGAGFQALSAGKAVTPGYIISVSRLAVTALPQVDEELLTEIVLQTPIPDIIVISGRVTGEQGLIATCEMKILTSV
jgi:predicted hotdog family 3-hydroxylacyl-ACP dehydratase